MTRREIFFIVSLVCLGIFLLFGTYMWKETKANAKEMEFNKETYTKQLEELQKEEQAAKTGQTGTANTQPSSPANTAVNPNTAATSSGSPKVSSNAAAAAASKINSLINSESKVGDIVKLGDVEMIVTKSTARHKVIEITLTGNTPQQQPKLILMEYNRILYEIPADVDVNVDITDKIVIDKSPIVDEEKKAGK